MNFPFQINSETDMKKFIFYISVILIITGCSGQKKQELISPDGNLKLAFSFFRDVKTTRLPEFSLTMGNKVILLSSIMELKMGITDSTSGFELIDVEKTSVRNSWINNFGKEERSPIIITRQRYGLRTGI